MKNVLGDGMKKKIAKAVLWGIALATSGFATASASVAAAPADAPRYQIASAKPANVDPTVVQPYIVRTKPAETTCRLGAFVIPSDKASLISQATAAASAGTYVNIVYSKDTDGFCVISQITTAASQTPPAVSSTNSGGASIRSPGQDLLSEGYSNPYATSFKAAYRDFGQGKFDEAVDPISGKLTLKYTDVVIPGPNGLDIRITRNYTSPDPVSIVRDSLEPHFNGFGWNVIANHGGIRGMIGRIANNEGATGDWDGLWLNTARLPQWVNGDGSVEALMPVDTAPFTRNPNVMVWTTNSGTRLTLNNNRWIATTTDGTVIEFGLLYDAFDQPVRGNMYPTRITDRWGNWLNFEYHVTYFEAMRLADGQLRATYLAGNVPLSRITASDGRLVELEYETPGQSLNSGLRWTDFALKRIRYGSHSIDFDYDRVDVRGSNIISTTSAKYFLKRVTRADGLQWNYTYGALPTNRERPVAGNTGLQTITYPQGGTSTYEWGPSLTLGARNSLGEQLPNTYQVRKKTSSANAGSGVWRFLYSDSNAASETNTRLPWIDGNGIAFGLEQAGSIEGKAIEVGLVIGPNSVEAFHHFTRWPGNNNQLCADGNPEGNSDYCGASPLWWLGKIYQHSVYPANTVFSSSPVPMNQKKNYVHEATHISSIAFRMSGPDPLTPLARISGGTYFPEGDAYTFHSRVKSVRTERGVKSYSSDNTVYDLECARVTTKSESGDRVMTSATVAATDSFCQVSSETMSESGARKKRVARTFTSDKKNVVSEISYGMVDSGGLTSRYTYYATGELETRVDPRGYTTRYDAHKRGTPQSELMPVDPNGTKNGATEATATRIQIARIVDDLGRITSETDGEGRAVGFDYNGQHKPTQIRPTRGSILDFTYGGAQVTVTRGSRVETVKYDGFGRVIESDNGVFKTKYRYDAGGRRTFVSYPGSELGQRVEYDALDRPIRLHEPDPSSGSGEVTTRIDYFDNLHDVHITAPNGGVTKLTMEAFGDPSQAWVKKVVLPDANAGSIEYKRNVFGQVEEIKSVSPAGTAIRTMKYDENNGYYLIEETHPELGTVKYERDASGNMIGRTVGASGKTMYAYDGQNRLISVTPPSGDALTPAISRTWYKTGKPKTVVAGGVTREYEFDQNDNLTKETVTIDGAPRALVYAYDSLDSLMNVTYPSGRISEFGPDLLGRPTKATPFVSSMSHHPSGMVREINFANETKQNFDEQRRPMVSLNKVYAGSNPLLEMGYLYDQNANMTSITEPSSSAQHGYTRSATYDLFDRIKTIGSESFTYKGIGDFDQTRNAAGVQSTYAYDGTNRRLTGISGAVPRSYSYDVYGNVTSDGRGFAFGYDAFSTLRSTSGGAANSQYVYDGHQHMAKQTTGSVVKQFLYGMSGRLFGEYPLGGTNATGAREFFYASGKMVGQAVRE
jgi:YD repeat-containing protein